MKKILVFSCLVLLFLGSLVQAQAQAQVAEELIVNFVLPPLAEIEVTKGGESLIHINEREEFQKNIVISESEVLVSEDYFGARVAMPSYYIYFRPFSKLKVEDNLELMQGSVWVKVLKGGDDFSMSLGSLSLKSSEGEFLLYISPDHDDLAVKVLSGSVQIAHEVNGQELVLLNEKMTKLDLQGYLIAPLPVEPDLITRWWEFEAYEESMSFPVADAGEDQYIIESAPVTLNGLNSVFNDGDVFEWTLVEGPVSEVIYDTSDITRPMFTPPAGGVYRFNLVVVSENGIRSEPDTVRIFVGENYLSTVQYFDDVSPSDSKSIAINYLRKHGVIRGYKDEVTGKSLFYPRSPVTRAQVLKIFFLGSNIDVPEVDETADTGFLDVSSDQWYAKYVRFAKNEEIIKGNPDGNYRPDQPVNRVAAIKIALEINKVNVETSGLTNNYSDVAEDVWFASYMAFAYENHLFDADENGEVLPDAEMTRDEVADLMYRLIKVGLVGARGKLMGYTIEADGETPVSKAQVQIYSTKESELLPTSENEDSQVTLDADALLRTVETDEDGSFLVTLPVGFYSVQVFSENEISQKSFTVEIQNQKTTSVMLETE